MKLALLALLISLPALGDDITFTLDPVGGTVAGTPGSVVGWGFTIESPTDFLLIDSFDFVSSDMPDGTFVDYSQIESTPVVGPSPESDIFTQSFDPVAITGVGEFDIAHDAVVGAVWTGSIVLTYDLYNVDPSDLSFDPTADLVSSGNTTSANAEIDVTAPLTTPEPSLGWLAGLCCLTLAAFRRRSQLAKIIPNPTNQSR